MRELLDIFQQKRLIVAISSTCFFALLSSSLRSWSEGIFLDGVLLINIWYVKKQKWIGSGIWELSPRRERLQRYEKHQRNLPLKYTTWRRHLALQNCFISQEMYRGELKKGSCSLVREVMIGTIHKLIGFKWSNLNAPGTENPLSHPFLKLGEFHFPTIGPLG